MDSRHADNSQHRFGHLLGDEWDSHAQASGGSTSEAGAVRSLASSARGRAIPHYCAVRRERRDAIIRLSFGMRRERSGCFELG